MERVYRNNTLTNDVTINGGSISGGFGATHAKPIQKEENLVQAASRSLLTSRKATPFNVGLKTPCQCGSGKKFKACCYRKPTVDWGWIVLGEDSLVPVAINTPELSEHPVILVHPTFEAATQYVNAANMARSLRQQLLVIRMNVHELCKHIELQFQPGQTMLVICPNEITADGTGAVYEVIAGINQDAHVIKESFEEFMNKPMTAEDWKTAGMPEAANPDELDEQEKVEEFERLVEDGLSEAEAQGTVWPEEASDA